MFFKHAVHLLPKYCIFSETCTYDVCVGVTKHFIFSLATIPQFHCNKGQLHDQSFFDKIPVQIILSNIPSFPSALHMQNNRG
jgi:hypothetical protein